MFVIPNLEVVVTDNSPTHGLALIESQLNVSELEFYRLPDFSA